MNQNNSNLLQDLKSQSKDGEVSTSAAIQLILGSLISLDTNITKIGSEMECSSTSNEKFQIDITKRVDELGSQVQMLKQDLKENREVVETIAKQAEHWCMPNPLISFGCFIKNNPKLFLFMLSAATVLIMLLGVPQIKHSLVIYLGFPEELADFVAPITTQTP